MKGLGESRSRRQGDVVSKMFFSASVAMIFTVLVGTAAQFFDGVITSRFLGNDAYSAIALFGPLNGIFLMLASFIASGNQIICSGYIGEGKKDAANSVFTFSIAAGLAVSALLILLCIVIPDPLLAFCGVTKSGNPALYDNMLAYVRGYLFGLPALITVQIIGPIIILDNGKKIFSISALVLGATDIALDLLNALVLHGGTFGMGVATSVSVIVQLAMLAAFLLRKDGRSRFSLKAFRIREIGELAKAGSPTLVQSFAVSLRDVSINRLNLLFAVSTAAIVARGVQYDFNMVLFCISDGLANTMVSMAGIYHSVSDKAGLRRVFRYGMSLSARFAAATFAVVFLLAPQIAGFYTSDAETAALGAYAIRCMALSQLADIPICVYINYLKGIRKRRMVIVLNVLDRFILPVVSAAVLAFLFGSKGLLASIALGKLLLTVAIVLILCVRNKRVPRGAEQFMLLPDDFGGSSSDNLYGSAATMEDVMRENERTEQFCLKEGTDAKSAMRIALFMEEMAGNVVQHGNPDVQKVTGVEYLLFVNDNRICLTLRDYNRAFDPTAWYRANADGEPDKGTGIRMVMALAEFDGVVQEIRAKHGAIKVYIATEASYHERYLKYCVEHGVDCLVEKPILLPLKDGKFDPEPMVERMAYYVEQAEKNRCHVSVMTLGRCHEIYADVVYQMIKEKMEKYDAPMTSFHIKHAGGVWNLHREYLTREDHPYRYGYGMLMHGGYHYVDLLSRFLLLNKLIFPEKQFEVAFTSYAAYPTDQNDRIPKPISERFDDNCPDWWKTEGQGVKWGETDITSTFCLRDRETKRVITLGTIAMEQTTPSVRTWTDFPEGLYNKNGRVSNLDMEIQLSTLFAASVKCYKIPRDDGKFVEHVPVKPHIITRAHPKLLPDEEYEFKKVYPECYNSTSNKRIMRRWLRDEETVSDLQEHLPVMKLMQAIAFSLDRQGESVVTDF